MFAIHRLSLLNLFALGICLLLIYLQHQRISELQNQVVESVALPVLTPEVAPREGIRRDDAWSHSSWRYQHAADEGRPSDNHDLTSWPPPRFNENEMIVVYNRIPKTGSTTFTGLAYDSCKRNNFNVLHINTTKNAHVMSLPDQRRFVMNVTNWRDKQPGFYHGHMAYIPFEKFGVPQPIYIQLIRKPLERLVSYYYFLRYGDDFRPYLKRNKMGDTMTFDECVEQQLGECDPDNLWLQIPFFCGMDPRCWEPGNQWALEQAKRVLSEKYLLVGLTEELEDFVALLEATIPRFFKGFTKLHRSGTKSHLRRTTRKDPLKAETVSVIQRSPVWQKENEFYEFAAAKFHWIRDRSVDETGRDKGKNFRYEKIRPKPST